jgi:hypothetical protein
MRDLSRDHQARETREKNLVIFEKIRQNACKVRQAAFFFVREFVENGRLTTYCLPYLVRIDMVLFPGFGNQSGIVQVLIARLLDYAAYNFLSSTVGPAKDTHYRHD